MPRINPVEELAPLKLTLGSQWWSVSSQTYINSLQLLKDNPSIEQYFKKIECSDESFFGTIFHKVSFGHISHGTTFVKWVGSGSPQPLTLDDIERERALGTFFFVRKVKFQEFGTLSSILNQ
jgi:hypothetical protein